MKNIKYKIVEVKLRNRLGRILSINEWRVILEDEQGHHYRLNAWAGVYGSNDPEVDILLRDIKQQITYGKIKKLKFLPEKRLTGKTIEV